MATVTKRRNRYALDYYVEGRRIVKSLPKGVRKVGAERKLRSILENIEDGS